MLKCFRMKTCAQTGYDLTFWHLIIVQLYMDLVDESNGVSDTFTFIQDGKWN